MRTQFNWIGLGVIVAIAIAGFIHAPWYILAVPAVMGFAWYEFDKASVGLGTTMRAGGGVSGINYVVQLLIMYGVAWAVGYGASRLFGW